jgi:hypothetical protein
MLLRHLLPPDAAEAMLTTWPTEPAVRRRPASPVDALADRDEFRATVLPSHPGTESQTVRTMLAPHLVAPRGVSVPRNS